MTAAQIAAFHNSWQDTGFAADCSYLTRLLRFLEKLKSSDAVLECGSGGTTLLADVTGTQRGFRTYSLEQDPEWALPVQRWLKGSAHILDAPLKNFPTYQWYDVREALPMHFALIICDGPYIDKTLGEPAHSAWRFGVLPWLSQTGRTFDALLLDDVNDARGPALLERWQKEFGVTVERLASPERNADRQATRPYSAGAAWKAVTLGFCLNLPAPGGRLSLLRRAMQSIGIQPTGWTALLGGSSLRAWHETFQRSAATRHRLSLRNSCANVRDRLRRDRR
jgi:hypothetical protein